MKKALILFLIATLTFLLCEVSAIAVFCYQENATSAPACGGYANGSYAVYIGSGAWSPVDNWKDGDYSTYSTMAGTYAEAYINYTFPVGVNITGIKAQFKTNGGTENRTLPASCYDITLGKVMINYEIQATTGNRFRLYCTKDNSVVYEIFKEQFYEEGIWWDLPSSGVSIEQYSPADGYISGNASVPFVFNFTQYEPVLACGILINGAPSTSNSSALINETHNTINVTLSDGVYNWAVNCTNGSNQVQTANRSIRVFTAGPIIQPTTLKDLYYTEMLNFSVNITSEILKNVTFSDGCRISYINTTITNPNFYFWNLSNVSPCSPGVYYLNVTAYDTLNRFMTQSNPYYLMSGGNFTARNIYSQAIINNFDFYINGNYYNSTTTGTVRVSNLSPGSYQFVVNASTYEINYLNLTLTKSFDIYNVSLYGENSLRISIFDEDTGAVITSNVSVKFTNNISEQTYSTKNGSLYIANLITGEYGILFSGNSSYIARVYTITIGNRTSQALNAYLPASTSSTVFTIVDADSQILLSNALITQYKSIYGSWQAIESKYSDITGKAQFSYVPLAYYKFFISKPEYQDYVFYLEPILFTTYDITMTKITLVNFSQDFSDVSLDFSPKSFISGENETFNFIIASPSGKLMLYGFSLSYYDDSGNPITISQNGINAIGGQLFTNLSPTARDIYDTVNLNYYYVSTVDGQYRNFTALFPYYGISTINNGTMGQNRDKTYGLGLLERILIVTISVIFVVGIATLIGQPIGGVVLSLFLFGFYTYTGFIPFWIIAISMFGGFMLLLWKSGY